MPRRLRFCSISCVFSNSFKMSTPRSKGAFTGTTCDFPGNRHRSSSSSKKQWPPREESRRGRRKSALPVSREDHNGPDFDRSMTRPRNFGGDGDRLVDIVRLHQVVAAKLFLGFRKRPIGYLLFAVANPHGFRCGSRLKGVAAADDFGELLAEGPVFLAFRILLGLAKPGPALLFIVNQQQKLHGLFSLSIRRMTVPEIDKSIFRLAGFDVPVLGKPQNG